MKMTLRIGGMHCAACSRAVERALKKTEGIEEANVNIATEKAVLSLSTCLPPGVLLPVHPKLPFTKAPPVNLYSMQK